MGSDYDDAVHVNLIRHFFTQDILMPEDVSQRDLYLVRKEL